MRLNTAFVSFVSRGRALHAHRPALPLYPPPPSFASAAYRKEAMGTDLNPAKKDFRKNFGTTGTGQKCQRRDKTCPVFDICAPKPRHRRVPRFTPPPFVPMRFCSLAAFSVSVWHTETREIICLPASPDLTKAPERIALRVVCIIPVRHGKKIENGAGI